MLQLSPVLLVFMGLATVVPHLSVLERVLVVAILPVSALFTIAMVSHQVRDRRLRQHELPVVSEDPWGEGPIYRY